MIFPLNRDEETIRVNFTNESAQRLVDFLESSSLIQYLKEIVICVEAPRIPWLMLGMFIDAQFDFLKSFSNAAIPDGWIRTLDQAFKSFHTAPRLRTVRMSFPSNRGGRALMSMEQDSILQLILLLTLASGISIPTIPELVLDNWISLASNQFLTAASGASSRLQYMPSVANLHINTQRYVMERMGFNDEVPLSFWQDTLPNYMLKPSMAVLTSLVICSDLLDGYSRVFDLSDIFFPLMACLSLSKLLFGNMTAVEDFIIRHADSLEKLKLLSCSVYIGRGTETSVRPWAQTWTRFAEELHALRSVTVDQFSTEPRLGEGSLRYTVLIGYTQMLPGNDESINLDEDDAALETLMKVVGIRTLDGRSVVNSA